MRPILLLIALLIVFKGTTANAELNTSIYYRCQNVDNGVNTGTACQIPRNPSAGGDPVVNASVNNNTTISVGDEFGSVSGQSTYGLLTGSASSAWFPDEPSPAYKSQGQSNTSFQDTLTFTGSTGNVNITVTIRFNSSVMPSTNAYSVVLIS